MGLIGSTCTALPRQHRRVLPGEPDAARAIVAAERAALARHEPGHFLEPPVEDFVESQSIPRQREAVRARREPGAYTRPLISST